jgi:hypothetical protein
MLTNTSPKRPNNMLNPARSARWTAPLHAGLPVSITLGAETSLLSQDRLYVVVRYSYKSLTWSDQWVVFHFSTFSSYFHSSFC